MERYIIGEWMKNSTMNRKRFRLLGTVTHPDYAEAMKNGYIEYLKEQYNETADIVIIELV